MHLIVSCSLNKNSKSKILANYASTLYNQEVKFLDLQTMELPFCDGDSCYDNIYKNYLTFHIFLPQTYLIILKLLLEVSYDL